MEMPIVTKAKPKQIDNKQSNKTQNTDKSSKSFNNTLKNCEEKKSDIKEDTKDEKGENETTVCLLQGLVSNMPFNPINLSVVNDVKQVENVADTLSGEQVGTISGVDDVVSQEATSMSSSNDILGNNQNMKNGNVIDPGFSKLINNNPDNELKSISDLPLDQVGDVTADSQKTKIGSKNNLNLQQNTLETQVDVDSSLSIAPKQKENLDDTSLNIDGVKVQSKIVSQPSKKDNSPINQVKVDTPQNKIDETVSTIKKINALNTDNKAKQSDVGKETDNKTADSSILINASQTKSKVTEFPKEQKVAVAEQITDGIKENLNAGRTEIKIHLNPEELGGISVRIISQNGALSVSITADNKLTSQLIASSMNELTRTMNDQGITMNKAEVSYQDDSKADTSTSQQQSNSFLENQENRENAKDQGYSSPKWTVASETHGKTAVDVIAKMNKQALG